MSQPALGSAVIARALRDEGVRAAAAFPGSPATSLAQAIDDMLGFDLRWSVNENDAVSFCFGHAMAGRGAVAIVKHVGVNVAHDALESMGVVHGLPAPLVIVEGQDARPGSSQNAQDNRPLWAGSVDVLVLAPGTTSEADRLTRAACRVSRTFGMPVVIRGDARLFGARGDVPARDDGAPPVSAFAPWPERGYGLATTAKTYPVHRDSRGRAHRGLLEWLDGLVTRWGFPSKGERGDAAVLVAGHLGAQAAAEARRRGVPGMRLLTEHPLPELRIAELLANHDRVVVLEECLPDLEQRVRAIAHRNQLSAEVVGRRSLGDTRPVGWVEGDALGAVLDAIGATGGDPLDEVEAAPLVPELGQVQALADELVRDYESCIREDPPRSFAVNDLRRPLFEKLRTLGEPRPTFVTTDPGVTGLLALGDGLSDCKMHMGGAVPMASGWSRARKDGLAIAAVGDTNLFHSEWMGILEATAAEDDLLVVVVDNGHSEMTAKITPLRPTVERAIASLSGLGCAVRHVRASTDSPDDWSTALDALAAQSGPRLCWLEI